MNIAVTSGDCNGIGPEAFFKALAILHKKQSGSFPHFQLIINPKTLQEYLKKLKISFEIKSNILKFGDFNIGLIDCRNYSKVQFGIDSKQSGALAGESINLALDFLKNGKSNAILTLPISKNAIQSAGFNFPGHTEMIASFFGVNQPLMILTSGKVRVALATIHEPLRKVPELLSDNQLIETIRIFNKSLKQDFNIPKPSIAVLGLNPHAGESGKIGTEENEIIIPAIKKCRALRINAVGPFPSDGFFGFGEYKKFDGILAMYHDQGLIPLKLLAKGGGVNFTAGLPIVRTSPDHGTAFPIAGKGIADPKSTLEAILLAMKICNHRKKYRGE